MGYTINDDATGRRRASKDTRGSKSSCLTCDDPDEGSSERSPAWDILSNEQVGRHLSEERERHDVEVDKELAWSRVGAQGTRQGPYRKGPT